MRAWPRSRVASAWLGPKEGTQRRAAGDLSLKILDVIREREMVRVLKTIGFGET